MLRPEKRKQFQEHTAYTNNSTANILGTKPTVSNGDS